MKKLCVIFFSVLILSSCKKEKETQQYGPYKGYKVITQVVEPPSYMTFDSTAIEITITEEMESGKVHVSVDEGELKEGFDFIHEDGKYKSTKSYHPPTLYLSNDSVRVYESPGMGPYWIVYSGTK